MSAYLRPEDIRALDSFEFAPKHVVEGYLAGRHRSASPGLSTEFRDYRPYVPGDDPRLIDWQVYARTDRYYLRTHNLETDTVCHLFLDSSHSMGFGDRVTKLEYGSFFAAAIAYLITRNRDQVSLQLFDRDIRAFHPPGSSGRHLNALLHALEQNAPGERTSLATALHRSFPLLRRRGTLIVISDFFDDPAAIFSALNPYLHQGFAIYLFHVLDPAELEMADAGLVAFEDMETGERLVTHTDALVTPYREAMGRHIDALRELSIRRRIHYTLARTDRSFYELFDPLVK